MPDQPPVPPTTQDFPDHWGFYLLQAINRLDDKIDDVRREQERTADSLRQEIGGVRQEIGGVRQEIHALDAKFEQKVDGLDAKFEQKFDALDAKFEQKFDALDAKFDQKIDGLDAKFDQKLTNLQYWCWGTLIVIIVGFVTVFFTHP